MEHLLDCGRIVLCNLTIRLEHLFTTLASLKGVLHSALPKGPYLYGSLFWPSCWRVSERAGKPLKMDLPNPSRPFDHQTCWDMESTRRGTLGNTFWARYGQSQNTQFSLYRSSGSSDHRETSAHYCVTKRAIIWHLNVIEYDTKVIDIVSILYH